MSVIATSAAAAASESAAAAPRALKLRELLAACFSVGSHAGQVIRDVVSQGVDLDVVNKADDKYDPQTVADRRSQQRIIHALRQVWPQVQIVGEEGELEQPDPQDVVLADLNVLSNVEFAISQELDGELSADDLVLWIDPLDGTKKFAEKKYDEVSVLIGIAYKKRPIAGVMHLPFWGPFGTTYWGGKDIGLFASKHEASASQTTHARQERPALCYPLRPFVITTSGTKCDLVNQALEELKPAQVELGGATGTMVLTVITGTSDLFFRFRNATKRWDICAMEPLLEAIGGTLVDKHGRVYDYDPQGDQEFDNEHGLVVSLESATSKWMLDIMAKVEILRTIDGDQAMTPEWLSRHIFQGLHHILSSSIVPGSVHRGKQSTVMKLQVEYLESPSETETGLKSQKTTKKTLFVKRYVKSELPPRSEAHWTRDLYSYRTESRFYSHFYATLSAFDVPLIKPLAVLYAKDAQGNEATDKFMAILESIDDLADESSTTTTIEQGYVHADCLQLGDAKQALTYLASLHAAALKNPSLVDQAAQDLWPSGGWWSFAKRGGMPALKDTPRIWKSVRTSFASELSKQTTANSDSASLESLAERMMSHAVYISSELFENYPSFLKTIVHGDFKSANLFFKEQSREVVAFDWQWCGVGIGALDVAYLLNTSASIEALAGGHEDELLHWYYDQFVLRLKESQVLQTQTQIQREYPFEAFERHYVLATLEYARVLISNFWNGMTPASCAAKFANTNCGLGYRSVPHVLRMIKKLDQGLRFVEREQEQERAI